MLNQRAAALTNDQSENSDELRMFFSSLSCNIKRWDIKRSLFYHYFFHFNIHAFNIRRKIKINYKTEKFSVTCYSRTKPELPYGDAEGMTMRWKYKEKRPTKVTIYNRHGARYRMSRAGVMREKEEEEEEEEDQEETATATMRGGTGGQARRRRYINNGSNKAGRKRGIKELRSKKGHAREKRRGRAVVRWLCPLLFPSFSRFLI